jgi:hypothetical protein
MAVFLEVWTAEGASTQTLRHARLTRTSTATFPPERTTAARVARTFDAEHSSPEAPSVLEITAILIVTECNRIFRRNWSENETTDGSLLVPRLCVGIVRVGLVGLMMANDATAAAPALPYPAM